MTAADIRPRCQAEILKKDTYRVARGTKSGFKMHYDRMQCTRAAVGNGVFCKQHSVRESRPRYRFAVATMGD